MRGSRTVLSTLQHKYGCSVSVRSVSDNFGAPGMVFSVNFESILDQIRIRKDNQKPTKIKTFKTAPKSLPVFAARSITTFLAKPANLAIILHRLRWFWGWIPYQPENFKTKFVCVIDCCFLRSETDLALLHRSWAVS